uniref:C-type lectin domain-containing protein n=1 Tax=Stegastes partitus TaxID=144197 RepID=A0A3B5ATT5_9TELE
MSPGRMLMKPLNLSPVILTSVNLTSAFYLLLGDMRIRVIEERLTWEDALDYCEKNHTSLLWMADENDQEAVQQWLDVNDKSGTFWIGMRQSTVFGFWIWKDRPVTVSNWKDGQQPEPSLAYQCGVLKTTDNNKWSNEHCLRKHRFICEEKIFKMNV